MTRCGQCDAEIPGSDSFCGSCGAPVPVGSQVPTESRTPSQAATIRQDSAPPPLSTPLRDERFEPGQVLAQRYRIVGMLGRGGMGEVYRADDLKLGLSVALKFLPTSTERDQDAVERFLNEARMALRVTHPNVTRVHDIGEVDGHHFLSMEFVDGEDLSALLRRIGRLPSDKAVDVARQICAGLAAAHEQGVLHRDLKPANIMLDGRGRVKITDFGLAGLDQTIRGHEARAGTPTYMAPEQWEGGEVTPRSDLWALGLVLCELFLGHKPVRDPVTGEVLRLRETSVSEASSSLAGKLDPAIERLILRCLETAPFDRPPSAQSVALALPGGDPLAAALAAGETPSPELVARTGDFEGTRPWVAFVCLVVFLVGVASSFWRAGYSQPARLSGDSKAPEFLAERAREILDDLGVRGQPADELWTFDYPLPYWTSLLEAGLTPEVLERVAGRRPAPLLFAYRESPEALRRLNPGGIGEWMDDPPFVRPGMTRLWLDLQGRLERLEVRPWETLPQNTSDPDWSSVFAAAGLKLEEFVDDPPAWTPQVFADTQRAWIGKLPESRGPDGQEIEVRVEAAALGGHVVWLEILGPWRQPQAREDLPAREGLNFGSVWLLAVLLFTAGIAWRNLRAGRGDRRGAFRAAVVFGALRMAWLLSINHLATEGEIQLLISHVAWSAYRVCLVWVFYIAIEPYARRLWPRMLTSWLRLADGRFRDPLVSRDVLLGLAAGGAVLSLSAAGLKLSLLLGEDLPRPVVENWYAVALQGGRHTLGALAGHLVDAVLGVVMMLGALLFLHLVLRRTWLACTGLTVLAVLLMHSEAGVPLLIPFALASILVFLGLLFRGGILALFVLIVTASIFTGLPLTPDFSAWSSRSQWIILSLMAVIAAWSFVHSLGGRKIFADDILAGGRVGEGPA